MAIASWRGDCHADVQLNFVFSLNALAGTWVDFGPDELGGVRIAFAGPYCLRPGALAARRQGLLSELLRRAQTHDELVDGHRLSFAATEDTLALVIKTVEVERQCCRFLRFQITVEPDGGPYRWN